MADLTDSPEDVDAVYQRGLAFYTAKDFASAESTFRRMLQLVSDGDRLRYALATYSLGVALIRLDRAGEAREWLERALSANPALSRARMVLKQLSREVGRPGPALTPARTPTSLEDSAREARPTPASPPAPPSTVDQAGAAPVRPPKAPGRTGEHAVPGFSARGDVTTVSDAESLISVELAKTGPRTSKHTLVLIKIGLVVFSLIFLVFALASYSRFAAQGHLSSSPEVSETRAIENPAVTPPGPPRPSASDSASEPTAPALDGQPSPAGEHGRRPAEVLTSGGQKWVVDVASLKALREAKVLTDRLALKGYEAYVDRTRKGKGPPTTYRVRIGPFKTKSEADTIAARLRKEEQLKPRVTPTGVVPDGH